MKVGKNHCSLASKEPEKEYKYRYAYGVLYRLKKGLATRKEIETELSKRSDEKAVREILNELRKQ